MTPETAHILTGLTDAFYRAQAASFSATRTQPWRGWARILPAVDAACDGEGPGNPAVPAASADVLDLGCGNLRFERYLAAARPQIGWRFHAVDNCLPLVRAGVAAAPGAAALDAAADSVSAAASVDPALPFDVRFQELDVMEALAAGPGVLASRLQAPACRAAVCFGVMHHVPGFAARVDLLRALVGALAPGGVAAVSFWRFLESPALARRARSLQPQALADAGLAASDLDADDYLLGWDVQPGVYRYCHHFRPAEIDALLDALGPAVQVVDRFAADGRTGTLNAYLVLRAR